MGSKLDSAQGPDPERFLDYSSEGFMCLDRELKITYFNPAAEKLLNAKRGDVLSKHVFYEAFPKAKGSIFEEKYRLSLETGEHLSFTTFFGAEPYTGWYLVNVHPVGEGLLVLFQVVTQQKRLEEQSRQARQIIDQSPAVVFVWRNEPGWPIDFVSDNVRSFLGYGVNELIGVGIRFEELIHEDDKERVASEVQKHLMDPDADSFSQEYRLICRDSSVLWVDDRTRIIRDDKGDVKQLQGILLDITDKKELEDKYMNLVEASLNPIFTVNREGVFEFMNTAAAKSLGGHPNDFIGKSMWELFPKEVADQQMKTIISAIDSGQVKTSESVSVIQGVPRNFHTCISPFTSRGRNLVTVIAVDVTEKKSLQDKLLKSEKKYKTIFENSADALFIHDLEGNFLEVNRTACERLGYTREELLKQRPQDIDAPEHAGKVPGIIQRILAEGSAYFETEHVSRSGKRIPTEINSTLIDFEGGKAVLSTARDVTERKNAQQALRKTQDSLYFILESSPDPIVIVDRDGVFTFVNKKAVEITGKESEDLVGKRFTELDFLTKESKKKILEHMSSALRGVELGNRYEIEASDAGGNPLVLDLHSAPVMQGNTLTSWIVTLRDVTEVRRIQEKNEETLDQLRTFRDLKVEDILDAQRLEQENERLRKKISSLGAGGGGDGS